MVYHVDRDHYAKCIEISKRVRWDIDKDVLAYPAASCGDRGRIPSGCAIMSGSFLAGKPRETASGFNARAIVFEGCVSEPEWPRLRGWIC